MAAMPDTMFSEAARTHSSPANRIQPLPSRRGARWLSVPGTPTKELEVLLMTGLQVRLRVRVSASCCGLRSRPPEPRAYAALGGVVGRFGPPPQAGGHLVGEAAGLLVDGVEYLGAGGDVLDDALELGA